MFYEHIVKTESIISVLIKDAVCAAGDTHKVNPKGFISIEVLIGTKTLDPTLQSVTDFVANGAPTNATMTSPLALVAKQNALFFQFTMG